MRFYRQKTWLLGLLALVAPLPLPFNQVVGWGAVIAFCGAALLFLLRTGRGEDSALPYWVMNLLGLAYIPFLVGDLALLRSGRVLQPLVHLALYAMAIKLFAIRKEKDKWHVFIGLFFLFVASMATSVHPAAIFYLLGFATLASLTLIRFAGLHTVSATWNGTQERRVPLRRLLGGMMVASVVAAAPLFFFLPRLRQPYVYLPAGGSGGVVQVSGFSDRFDLGTIDRVRSTRTVVFRFAYETPPPPLTEMRFKATTYDLFADGAWRRERNTSASVPRERDGFFHLEERFPSSWMKIWLRQGGQQMVLPVEATVVDLPRNGVVLDDAGEARFLFPISGIIDYRVGMGPEPAVGGWRRDRSRPSELAVSAISPRMVDLAATVMGSGALEERIRRLERYLRSEYRYSLDSDNGGPNPVERFLFDTREGHCEYFATAMALLLRSQSVPTRLVTGYLGSDYNPLEEYFIVRQSNAHAWVEAFVPFDAAGVEEGARGRWMIFDPTPADARPQSGREGLLTLMTQAYDYLLFRWDRYVLTYGFADQVDVFIGLRDAWARFWQAVSLTRDEPGRDAREPIDEKTPAPSDAVVQEGRAPFSKAWHWAPLLMLSLAVALWGYLRRERFTATKAYRSLRAEAASRDDTLPRWIGPLRLEERLSDRYPDAAPETRCIVSHYVRESFAGEELTESQVEAVRAAWGSARKKLRKSA